MCEVISASTAAYLAIASVVASSAATVHQVNQQKSQARQNYAAADKATRDSYADLNYRQLQENVSTNQQQQENSRRAAVARSTAATAAGESGVSGNSVSALMAEIYGQEARFNNSVAQQNEYNIEQLQAVKRGEATSNMNRKMQTPMPSYAAAGLRIANNAISTYGAYENGAFGPKGEAGGTQMVGHYNYGHT